MICHAARRYGPLLVLLLLGVALTVRCTEQPEDDVELQEIEPEGDVENNDVEDEVTALRGWPSFRTLWWNFPKLSGDSLVRRCNLYSWLGNQKNVCAVRLTCAFVNAGRRFNDLSKSQCSSWSGEHSQRGDKYMLRVSTVRCYLERRKGRADIVSTREASYRGSRGVIVFERCRFQSTDGHVDLWDGSRCAGGCSSSYFNLCSSIRLFKFY